MAAQTGFVHWNTFGLLSLTISKATFRIMFNIRMSSSPLYSPRNDYLILLNCRAKITKYFSTKIKFLQESCYRWFYKSSTVQMYTQRDEDLTCAISCCSVMIFLAPKRSCSSPKSRSSSPFTSFMFGLFIASISVFTSVWRFSCTISVNLIITE